MEVTPGMTSDVGWDLLGPFIAAATDWEDHPDARPEIETAIRQQATRLLEACGE